MPTVLREGPYTFSFFASHRDEPRHIHIKRDRECEASFNRWLAMRGEAPNVYFRFASARWTARPMSAGLSATSMPAASRAAIFSAAVPLPPEMIAPAWPMRLPGGAVRPAMNAATGLVTCCFDVGGGFFFGGAADFAHHQDRFGLRVGFEQLQAGR